MIKIGKSFDNCQAFTCLIIDDPSDVYVRPEGLKITKKRDSVRNIESKLWLT